MYKIIETRNEIKEYQERFIEILKYNTEQRNGNVGTPAGGGRRNLFWSSYKFWFITINKETRYWNAFGLDEGRTPDIIIEINFSLEGSRASGKLLKNEKGNIAIAHNGNCTKIIDKHNSEKINFLSVYKGKKIDVNGVKMALIGELPDDENYYLDFQKKIRDFIVEVNNIKNEASITSLSTEISSTKKKRKEKQDLDEIYGISANKKKRNG